MRDLIKTIFNILKYAGRTITFFRNVLFNTIFILLLVIVLVSLLTSKKEITFEPDSALLLTISGDIVEQKQIIDPFSEFLNEATGFADLPDETLLQDILDVIEAAADDSRINSIVLDLSRMERGSLNHLHDIGLALERFKQSGKKVIAAEDFYTQNMYFLASYADKIFLNPAGIIDIHGFGAFGLYFKDALEKLKINYHVFRVGSYKSAVEPLTRNSMSEEAKEQNSLWLGALWQEYTDGITARRNIFQETIALYTNNISSLLRTTDGDLAQLALKTKMVDELKSRYELETYLTELTGGTYSENFSYIPFKQYLSTISRSYVKKPASENAVGIIVAQGNIVPGEQPPGVIGSDSLLEVLTNARDDEKIKAVVLRVDSGGGSVFASELIRREIQVLRESGKPVVVSMGSMAASGGYWIAAEADEIWAYPTTLTGSIGIFGAIPTFEDSLAHLGIYGDGVGTTELAAGLNITRPLSPELKAAVQLTLEHGYNTFLDIVARGRNMEESQVNTIAEGKVFDGRAAMNLGLVDKLGNLSDAIKSAADLAQLEDYTAEYVKGSRTVSERLMSYLQTHLFSFLIKFGLGETYSSPLRYLSETAKNLLLFQDPQHIYAHCLINYY